MATIVSKPGDVFQNNNAHVGKFCMTDEEMRLANKQFRQDTLEAILIVSKEEKQVKEMTTQAQHYRGWYIEHPAEKSWYEKMKDKVAQAHESAVIWYEDWKEGKKEEAHTKTFEEKVEEVRIHIAETRRLEKEDPGYEC